MDKSIRILKSFKEHDKFQLEQMRNSTIENRFRKLYMMQEITKLLHPPKSSERKIIICNELDEIKIKSKEWIIQH